MRTRSRLLASIAVLAAVSLLGSGAAGSPGGDLCPGDTDGDGEVGFIDLLEVLANWGPNPGHPADFDDSGSVDFQDLLLVLSQWGPCP